MNIHKNARLTPLRREEMALSVVEGRLSKADAARTYACRHARHADLAEPACAELVERLVRAIENDHVDIRNVGIHMPACRETELPKEPCCR